MCRPSWQTENIHYSGKSLILTCEHNIKFIFNFYNSFKLSKACRGLQNIDQTKALDDRSQNAVRVAHSVRNLLCLENIKQLEIINIINKYKEYYKYQFSVSTA